MKALNLTNFGIIAGAVAVGFILHKAAKASKAMQAVANPVDYSPAWADNITGNKEELIYV